MLVINTNYFIENKRDKNNMYTTCRRNIASKFNNKIKLFEAENINF